MGLKQVRLEALADGIFAIVMTLLVFELKVPNLRVLAEKKGIEIKTKYKNIPKEIETDEQRFEEILNNLISNSLKFTEKGHISVEAIGQDRFLQVNVKDTGIGIPKDQTKNMFKSFYQVDASISRKFGGTGLGLSITKQLIEMLGGKIWFESEPGKGTTFSFTLPFKSEKIQTDPKRMNKATQEEERIERSFMKGGSNEKDIIRRRQ